VGRRDARRRPEAPTTTNRKYNYGPLTGGVATGSLVVDPGLDPEHRPAHSAGDGGPRAGASPASNWLIVSPQRSATGNSVAVMGPQLGYYYPEIVMQIDLHDPGFTAQGAAVPGLRCTS
jgi:acyl-homoserine lactone acylase PvdQ